jgi:ABC-type transport system involved in multi-copper enzyme maturation permease subunit
MSQIGLVVLLLTFSGMLPCKYAKGMLTNLLAKGLSRKTVALSKFKAAAALWTACYPLAFIVALGYTIYF